MSLLSELKTVADACSIPVETGVFSGVPPDLYLVITPMVDTFELHADNSPGYDTQEARLSLFVKGSYPWYHSYITNLNVVTSAKLGTSTSAKVGFFGTTPVSRKTVSRASGSTVASCNTAINNLITALKGYGLIN